MTSAEHAQAHQGQQQLPAASWRGAGVSWRGIPWPQSRWAARGARSIAAHMATGRPAKVAASAAAQAAAAVRRAA